MLLINQNLDGLFVKEIGSVVLGNSESIYDIVKNKKVEIFSLFT